MPKPLYSGESMVSQAESLGARIGLRVRELRRRVGLTQEGLAQRANVSKGYIGSLETGHVDQPSDEMLQNLASGLGVEAAEIQPVDAVAVVQTSEAVAVAVVAEGSAGRGPGYRLRGEEVLVPKAEAGNRALIAVKVVGECMRDNFKPDDLVIFEKVTDDAIKNGDIVCVTVRGRGEDGAYLIKYLAWDNDNESVVLTADDGTRLKLPYEDVIIEGRYFDMRRPRAAGR